MSLSCTTRCPHRARSTPKQPTPASTSKPSKKRRKRARHARSRTRLCNYSCHGSYAGLPPDWQTPEMAQWILGTASLLLLPSYVCPGGPGKVIAYHNRASAPARLPTIGTMASERAPIPVPYKGSCRSPAHITQRLPYKPDQASRNRVTWCRVSATNELWFSITVLPYSLLWVFVCA